MCLFKHALHTGQPNVSKMMMVSLSYRDGAVFIWTDRGWPKTRRFHDGIRSANNSIPIQTDFVPDQLTMSNREKWGGWSRLIDEMCSRMWRRGAMVVEPCDRFPGTVLICWVTCTNGSNVYTTIPCMRHNVTWCQKLDHHNHPTNLTHVSASLYDFVVVVVVPSLTCK